MKNIPENLQTIFDEFKIFENQYADLFKIKLKALLISGRATDNRFLKKKKLQTFLR